MSPGLWAQVSALFDDLRDRPAPEREARLLAHSDDTTRAAVTGMLQAYHRDPAFDPAAAVGDTLGDVLAPALIGRRLGAYRLVAEIGRGGMGGLRGAARRRRVRSAAPRSRSCRRGAPPTGRRALPPRAAGARRPRPSRHRAARSMPAAPATACLTS